MALPQYRQRIHDFVCGDSLRVDRVVLAIPDGLTVDEAWMTIKASVNDIDAAAVVQLDITTTATSDGQILDDAEETGKASLRFTLLPSQTLLLVPGREYVWDIQILLSDTGLYTPCKGTIVGEQQVTIATS